MSISEIRNWPMLASLHTLNITGTSIEDISALINAPRLARFYAGSTRIDDYSSISNANQLQRISIEGTPAYTLRHFANLKELMSLNVGRTSISDLAPLSELRKLERLSIVGTPVKSLAPIENCQSLVDLDASNTFIETIQPLKQLTQLRWLELSQTAVSDLDPVAYLNDLIPEKMSELRYNRGLHFRQTPAARTSPFRYLFISQGHEPIMETIETINYHKRKLGLAEKFPSDYKRSPELAALIETPASDTTEVFGQRPAAFNFAIKSGKIEADPTILASSNPSIASDIYDAILRR